MWRVMGRQMDLAVIVEGGGFGRGLAVDLEGDGSGRGPSC